MSKRGDMFKRIFALLEEGHTVPEIVKMGYSERTVYWASQQRQTGKRPEVKPGETQDWVTTGLKAGWIHRCEDGGLAILEDEEIETDEGIVYNLVCPRCKKVIASRFSKWTPSGKESYLTGEPARSNIPARLQMRSLR